MVKLPDFLRDLPIIYFYRRPARTYAESMRKDVIYGVTSLDDLFEKATQRGLLPKQDSSEQQSQSVSSARDGDNVRRG